MKTRTFLALMVAGIILLSQCVQGPAIIDPHVHAPENAIPLTESNFDSLVMRQGTVAIVEFYQPGCGACQSVMWVIDSLARDVGDSVFVGAVNADGNATLLSRFAVGNVPSYLFFSNGEAVTRRSYAREEPGMYDTLAALARALLAGALTPDTVDTATPPDTTPADYLTLDTLSFDTTVLRQGRVAMVFFLYAGGAPCIYMDSVVKEIAPLYEGKAIIAKVHAWEQISLSNRYGISSVPRFLFFKDSALVEQRIGILPADTLKAILDRLLARAIVLDFWSFDSLVALPGLVAMVDFFNPYCYSCTVMDTVVENLAARFAARALVGKVNVLDEPSLSSRFSIEGTPTFVFFKSGTEYRRIVGAVSGDTLAAAIEQGLAMP